MKRRDRITGATVGRDDLDYVREGRAGALFRGRDGLDVRLAAPEREPCVSRERLSLVGVLSRSSRAACSRGNAMCTRERGRTLSSTTGAARAPGQQRRSCVLCAARLTGDRDRRRARRMRAAVSSRRTRRRFPPPGSATNSAPARAGSARRRERCRPARRRSTRAAASRERLLELGRGAIGSAGGPLVDAAPRTPPRRRPSTGASRTRRCG